MINGAHFPGAGTYYLVATATPGCGAVTTSNEITVLVGSTIATNVVAASDVAGTSIHITWNAAAGASSYDVQKKVGASFTTIGTTSNLFFDDTVTPDGAYLYRIHTGGGDSANTYAGTFIFTDAPVTNSTPIRIVHFTQLRNAAAAMRALAGILPFSFTDPTLTNSTPIRRIHLIEIRQAVDEARNAMSVPAISYGELAIQAGVTTVKVSHIQELRSGER
jgi:hypothetical protein